MHRCLVLIILVTFIFSINTYGDGWWNAERVTKTDFNDYSSKCVFDINEMPHAVYLENRGSEVKVFYAFLDYDRTWRTFERQIAYLDSKGVDITVFNIEEGEGEYKISPFLVWEAPNRKIHYEYYDGENWVSGEIPSDREINYKPIVAGNSYGEVWVFWSAVNIGEEADLYYSYANQFYSGFSSFKKFELSDDDMDDITCSISVDLNGDPWIVWKAKEDGPSDEPGDIKVAKWDRESEEWVDMGVHDDNGIDADIYCSAYNYEGTALVWSCFEDETTNVYSDVWIPDSGWLGEEMVHLSDPKYDHHPSVVFFPGPLMFCSFTRGRVGTNEQVDIYGVWGIIDGDSYHWDWTGLVISHNRDNLDDDLSDLSLSYGGNMVCLWTGEDGEHSQDDLEIYFRYYDGKPPIVMKTKPEDGDTDVPVDVDILIFFDELIDIDTVNSDTISIKGKISGERNWEEPQLDYSQEEKLFQLTLPLIGNFSEGDEVTITVEGVEDYYNNPCDRYVSTFWTEGSSQRFMDDKVYPWPNPVSADTVNIRMTLYHNTHLTFEIYDVAGRRIKTIEQDVEPRGEYDFPLFIGDLGSDVYIVVLTAESLETDDEKQFIQKIAVVR